MYRRTTLIVNGHEEEGNKISTRVLWNQALLISTTQGPVPCAFIAIDMRYVREFKLSSGEMRISLTLLDMTALACSDCLVPLPSQWILLSEQPKRTLYLALITKKLRPNAAHKTLGT